MAMIEVESAHNHDPRESMCGSRKNTLHLAKKNLLRNFRDWIQVYFSTNLQYQAVNYSYKHLSKRTEKYR